MVSLILMPSRPINSLLLLASCEESNGTTTQQRVSFSNFYHYFRDNIACNHFTYYPHHFWCQVLSEIGALASLYFFVACLNMILLRTNLKKSSDQEIARTNFNNLYPLVV